MQIHFINQMVLLQLYKTELMLKNIEKCKRIQSKKRFHISRVHLHEDAANVFNEMPSYPCKFTSSITWFWLNSTVLKPMLKNIKKLNRIQTKERFHIFLSAHLQKHN